ncbi:hypothetical protein Efla_004456 [Eimeria flavescens]
MHNHLLLQGPRIRAFSEDKEAAATAPEGHQTNRCLSAFQAVSGVSAFFCLPADSSAVRGLEGVSAASFTSSSSCCLLQPAAQSLANSLTEHRVLLPACKAQRRWSCQHSLTCRLLLKPEAVAAAAAAAESITSSRWEQQEQEHPQQQPGTAAAAAAAGGSSTSSRSCCCSSNGELIVCEPQEWRPLKSSRQLLELLGFEAAAALPGHLHAAVLQLLLLSNSAAACTSSSRLGRQQVTWSGVPRLRSESCVVECLFSSWLTKSSKWLKAPRLRYVLLLAVTPTCSSTTQQQLQRCNSSNSQQLLQRSSSSGGCFTASTVGSAYLSPGRPASTQPDQHHNQQQQQQQEKQQQQQKQLLLVAFKLPPSSPSPGCLSTADLRTLQRAEPSEAFAINNKHVIEGLGGRLFVLGEAPPSAGELPSEDSPAAFKPLEELARLINEAAPCCPPPQPARWEGLLMQVFGAAALSDGFELPPSPALSPSSSSSSSSSACSSSSSSSIQPTQQNEDRQEEGGGGQPGPKRRCWRGHLSPASSSLTDSEPGCPEIRQPAASSGGIQHLGGRSLLTFLLRCSAAACRTVCRPLSLVLPNPLAASSSRASSRRAADGQTAVAAAAAAAAACSSRDCPLGCLWLAGRSKGRGEAACGLKDSQRQKLQHCSLRQLIDEQQRALAAFAFRDRCCSVALLQQEQQLRKQQVSKALMDEHGQLHPQVTFLSIA